MPTYDASSAEVHVFSFKDGLLAKLAHDLEMRLTKFSLEVAEDGGAVTGTFDPKSLEVLHAMKSGRPDPGTLSAGDKKKILGNATDDVLEIRRYGDASFRSTSVRESGASRVVTGDLTLHGKTRSVTATVREEGGHWVTEVDLHQPDFGIKPFKALGGALKVKADVRVRVRVPRG